MVPADWNGTWRLVPSKSQIPGSNFQVTVGEGEEYTFDYGAYKDRFRCDGREHHLSSGKTISCTQASAFAFDSIARRDGVLLNTAHWEVSADQRMLSIKMTAPQPSGSEQTKEVLYERLTGTKGFAGSWKDLNHLRNRPQLLVLTPHGRSLYYGFPEVGQYAEVEVDGADTLWRGHSVPAGSTIAIRIQDRSELLVVRKLNGVVINQGSMTIVGDGHTLVEALWSPDRPDLKTILTYEK